MSLTQLDQDNIRAVVNEMVSDQMKINHLQENIKEAAKGIEEKYTKDVISASDVKLMAKLELLGDAEIVEKQEKSERPYELFDLIMRKNKTS